MKEKKSKKKIIIIVVAALIVLGIAFGSQDDDKDTAPTSSTSSTNTESGEGEESEDDSEKIYQLDETAEYDDVKITIKDKKISKGNDWAKPAKGKKFLLLKILVENNSEEDIIISSMADFEAYCDDYKLDYSSDALIALSVDKSKDILDGTVASGKKLEGYLGYEVPKDWKSVELHYTNNIWTDDKVKFIIEK